jgi:thiol-disulfide isomerase/thioredoxin
MTARSKDTKRRLAKRRVAVVLAGGLAGAAAGLAAVYGIAALARNAATEPECRATAELVKRVAPLARGEVAAMAVTAKPSRVPDLTFRDGEGSERTLTEWRGRTVLLNLWATWCGPCRKEMPALDELQAKLGGNEFEVVAVNIDTRALDKPKAWLKEIGINRLAYYADSSAKVFQDLKSIGRAFGMPTTLLVDPNGCEIGHLAGPAEWASEDAVKLVRAALAK